MFLEKEKKTTIKHKKEMSELGSVEVVWIMMASYCAWKSSVWTVTYLKLAVWILETLVRHKVFIKNIQQRKVFSSKHNFHKSVNGFWLKIPAQFKFWNDSTKHICVFLLKTSETLQHWLFFAPPSVQDDNPAGTRVSAELSFCQGLSEQPFFTAAA